METVSVLSLHFSSIMVQEKINLKGSNPKKLKLSKRDEESVC